MKALRDGASGGLTKFILLGFMALAVGGLVMTDVGGFFRGGVGSNDVARVGDETIKITDFDRTLRRSISPIGLSPQDAYRFGYTNQVLGGEIRSSLLKQAGSDLGILVSDERAADEIQELIRPLTANGQDPKDVFQQVLRSQGLNEGVFVKDIKRDIGNNLLVNTINSAFTHIDSRMAVDLYKHQNEKRNVRYIAFMDDAISTVKPPSDQQIEDLYNATKESYAIPERRVFKILTLDMKALRDSLSISDGDIEAVYKDNIDAYRVPATWELDQAILPTQTLAMKTYNALKRGAPLKEAVEDITSNTSAYVGRNRVSEAGIMDAIKEPIMSTKKAGKILEPIESPLGWHVIKVTDIDEAHTKPLKEVRKDIEDELAASQLIDHQYELANTVDDMLASGATLDEVAQSVKLVIKDMPAVDQFGMNGSKEDVLNDPYGETKSVILETGFSLLEGETSAIFETQDGQFMAVYLHRLEPKSYVPLSEIKNALAQKWIKDQKRIENKAFARKNLEKAESLEQLAKANQLPIKSKASLERTTTDAKPFMGYSVANIFEAPVGNLVMVDIEGGSAILEVTKYTWPNVDTKSVEFKAFEAQLANAEKEEALRVYLVHQQQKRGARVNERLIKQVYGPSTQIF